MRPLDKTFHLERAQKLFVSLYDLAWSKQTVVPLSYPGFLPPYSCARFRGQGGVSGLMEDVGASKPFRGGNGLQISPCQSPRVRMQGGKLTGLMTSQCHPADHQGPGECRWALLPPVAPRCTRELTSLGRPPGLRAMVRASSGETHWTGERTPGLRGEEGSEDWFSYCPSLAARLRRGAGGSAGCFSRACTPGKNGRAERAMSIL